MCPHLTMSIVILTFCSFSSFFYFGLTPQSYAQGQGGLVSWSHIFGIEFTQNQSYKEGILHHCHLNSCETVCLHFSH